MKLQLLLAVCATVGTMTLANVPAEYPVKEAADITKPAEVAQPSDEELAKLKQQLESIGQEPMQQEAPDIEENAEQAPVEQQTMPEAQPAPMIDKEEKPMAKPAVEMPMEKNDLQPGQEPITPEKNVL